MKNKNQNTQENTEFLDAGAPLLVYDKPKAIYARQSKDRKESISIDAQIERCKRQLEPGEPFEVFIDRVSGKDINRPQFKKMLGKIENDEFSGVIVYKLDRFTRSVANFMEVHAILEVHDTKFYSCNESFDTSTPLGRMMLTICAAFAQMERETIVERCRDSYYHLAEKGLFPGGGARYGYDKVPAVKDGYKTSMLVSKPHESEIVKRMYSYYTDDLMSFAEILTVLNGEKPQKPFTRDGIKYILRNCVYVKADEIIYDYLVKEGANILTDLSEFNGINGIFSFSDPKKRKAKKLDTYRDENIYVGLHEGLIESEMWLKSQKRLSMKKSYKRDGKSAYTWLSGLTVCGYCNLALTFSRGGSRNVPRLYATCAGRKDKYCLDRKKKLLSDQLEAIVEAEMFKYLKKLPQIRTNKKGKEKTELKALKNKLINLKFREEDVQAIARKYAENNLLNLLRPLDDELSEIEIEKQNLQDEIQQLEDIINNADISMQEINDYVQRFKSGDVETKKKIAALIIEKIVSTDDVLEIHYRI